MKFSTFGRLIRNPFLLFPMGAAKGWFHGMDDRKYLKACYRAYFGKKLDLENPQTFSEKIQWLKLNDRNPLYTDMVDKYKVKKWVASKIGDVHVVPTFDMWRTAEEIDISSLPNQFVLKTNHDSGGVVICRDKDKFDIEDAKSFLSAHLQNNFFYVGREWPYKDVEPVVFAEKYLDGFDSAGMIDYKFYCFNGEPKFLYVSKGLEDHETAAISFLNLDWTRAPFARNDYRPFEILPEKPLSYDVMLHFAHQLSEGIPFVRVDFFEYEGTPYFSEMTFYPCAGFMPFEPDAADSDIGLLLNVGLEG